MDPTILVERDVEEGRQLVQALDAEGFAVTAALWYYIADEEIWQLIIASPIVADRGPRAGYAAILRVLDTRGSALDHLRIKAESSDDAMIISLRLSAGTPGAPFLGGTFYHRSVVGGTYILKAYVYRAERIVEESGTKELTVVFRDKQAKVWRAYPSVLTVEGGRIQEVKVEGHEVRQSRSRKGLNVRLNVLARHRVKRGQTLGDVQRWTVTGGQLQSIEHVAYGVRVEGLVDTKASA
jgi:hypothetical protein